MVATNEQRREAAKRKLQQELEERAQRARRRTRMTIAGSVLAAVLVAAAGVGVYYWKFNKHNDGLSSVDAAPTADAEHPDHPKWPAPKTKPATVSCQYTKSDTAAAKPNLKLPHNSGVKTTDNAAHVSVSMVTSQGNIGLTLDTAESPCTVNSIASLIGQGYFDNTPCHRLTTEGIKVLQCGDPTGKGDGGPGYQFANEYPTDQYAEDDPKAQTPHGDYKRGVIAMANAGPGTNGSQFFLVYGDSQLPPQYTVFGTIDQTGLKTLDKIAAAGVDPAKASGPGDGAPKLPVTIKTMALD